MAKTSLPWVQNTLSCSTCLCLAHRSRSSHYFLSNCSVIQASQMMSLRTRRMSRQLRKHGAVRETLGNVRRAHCLSSRRRNLTKKKRITILLGIFPVGNHLVFLNWQDLRLEYNEVDEQSQVRPPGGPERNLTIAKLGQKGMEHRVPTQRIINEGAQMQLGYRYWSGIGTLENCHSARWIWKRMRLYL